MCAACEAANPDRAKFCLECGLALAAAVAPTEVRKTVTVLFCDVTGSTALGERLDAEAMRAVMGRYFAVMSTVVQSHGGTVEKFIGDAVMAVFGVPVLHEDDALRALRAAHGMRGALEVLNGDLERDHGVRLGARIGVNTGEVVVGTDGTKGTVATGDAVNVAARLEQAAGPGEVLFGAPTWELVRHTVRADPVAPLTLKGKATGVPAWQLIDVASSHDLPRPMTMSSRLVGRDQEIALLGQAMARSSADRRAQLVTVLGAGGVGKSRLLEEALSALAGDATVLRGRCLSYGEDIVFWPLQQMLRHLAGLGAGADDETGWAVLLRLVSDDPEAERVVSRLAPVAGLGGTPAEAEEIHWAFRRLVEALGRPGPVVVVLDDVHWAEPALLDVVDHLADWTRDTALLLVCLARPELLDARPHWGGGKLNATTVLLEPLRPDAAAELLEDLLAGAALDVGIRDRILAAAGGMPLYVEQMLAMLADDGLLTRDGSPSTVTGAGGAVGAVGPVDVPPTIAALLAARLDRLPGDERAALEAAATVGLTFYRDAVAELVSAPPSEAGRSLMALSRKELVRPDVSDLPGDDGFRFLHVLVRDAAYAAIPKSRRADLHERFARWLDKRGESLGADVDEFVGHHLEQAVLLRSQLGPLSAGTTELAAAAADRLVAAGRRLPAADPVSAASLYDRAAALIGTDNPAGIDHLRAAGAALEQAGDLTAARDRYETAAAAARAAGDERRALLCTIALVVVRGHLDGDRDNAADLALVDDALRRFRTARDDEGVLIAGWATMNLLNERATWGPIVELVDELLPVAARTGNVLVRDTLVRRKGNALFYGPTPIRHCLEWIDANPDPATRSTQIGQVYTRAAVLAQQDRAAECREALAHGEVLLSEASIPLAVMLAAFHGAEAWKLLDDPQETERILRRGVDLMLGIGERSWLSSLAPMLGEARLELGDAVEARALAELGRETASPSDFGSQAQWRALLARVEALGGRLEAATSLADEALAWIEQTDQIGWVADIRAARAEVHERAGRPDAARGDLRVAVDLLDRKGNLAGARRARARLEAIGS